MSSTNTVPQAAPSVTPVPAPVVSPQQAPDLSGLTAPASQPNLATAVQGSMAPYEQAAQTATQKATQLAQPTPPPVPGPHARLLSMVQGLALGLGSFGTALATHGREGGIQEVQEVLGQQQQQKIQAQEFAQQQKNIALQQQLTIADTNQKQAQNILMLSTLPTDLQLKDLQVQSAKAGLATSEADFRASHFGMAPADFNSMMSGGTTAASNPQTVGMLQTGARQQLSAAIDNPEVGAADPYVRQLQTVLANPNAAPKDIWTATQNLQNQINLRHGVTAATTASVAGLPKNEQDAAAQLSAAQASGDPTRIQKAQGVYDAVHKVVQDERQFASNLQEQNQKANKQIALTNTLAQKGIEDTNKIWTDPQHGFSQTRAQIDATKDAAAQAKNGSQLAANLEPVMTALGVNSFAGVHRINQTEIDNAGSTVGSLYRRLNAALDKAGAGAVPAATLQEVNGIMDALLQTKYRSSLDSTRQIVANSGIPEKNVFVPDPNNFGALTTLDKVAPSPTTQTNQQQTADPFAAFGGKQR